MRSEGTEAIGGGEKAIECQTDSRHMFNQIGLYHPFATTLDSTMGVEGINHAPLGALNNTPNGPIPLFDQNLRALGDSYLTFFSERIRIEEG
jgi:hypothetical protein